MTKIFFIAMILFVMQSVGGVIQVKDYKRTIKKLHKKGTVGIGQRKSGFFSSYIIMIVCDNEGLIIDSETLDGIFICSRFHKIHKFKKINLVNEKISDVSLEIQKKESKYYSGLNNAINALIEKVN